MAKKKGTKVQATQEPARSVKAVRLDLSPSDHERLERHATKRGLSMAAFVRMFILEKLDELDSGR